LNIGSHPASGISKIDPNIGPIQFYLGIFGMTGLTAYFGLKNRSAQRTKCNFADHFNTTDFSELGDDTIYLKQIIGSNLDQNSLYETSLGSD